MLVSAVAVTVTRAGETRTSCSAELLYNSQL